MRILRIKELSRKLKLQRGLFYQSLDNMTSVFGFDNEKYIDEYELLNKQMLNVGKELINITSKMNELDLEFERLKKSILLRENINLKKELEKFGNNKTRIVEDLYKWGFISTEENEILKKDIWDNRYRKIYSD